VRGIVVILGETLADFAGGDTHDRVGIGIIAGRPVEDIHTNGTFFDLIGVSFQRLFYDETEKDGITFALEKERVGQEQLELREDGILLSPRLRYPRLERGTGGTRIPSRVCRRRAGGAACVRR
jgi:hypothetical protein